MKKQSLLKTKLTLLRETLRSIAVLDIVHLRRAQGGGVNTEDYPCSQKGTCGPP